MLFPLCKAEVYCGQELELHPEILLKRHLTSSTRVQSILPNSYVLNLGRPDTLELIFAVKVEIMLYAADHYLRDGHARVISNAWQRAYDNRVASGTALEYWTYVFRYYKIA
ncbi:unnamed protein product [Urochloa humidicola]